MRPKGTGFAPLDPAKISYYNETIIQRFEKTNIRYSTNRYINLLMVLKNNDVNIQLKN